MEEESCELVGGGGECTLLSSNKQHQSDLAS